MVLACAGLQNFLVDTRNQEEIDDDEFIEELLLPDADEGLGDEMENYNENAARNRFQQIFDLFRAVNQI